MNGNSQQAAGGGECGTAGRDEGPNAKFSQDMAVRSSAMAGQNTQRSKRRPKYCHISCNTKQNIPPPLIETIATAVPA